MPNAKDLEDLLDVVLPIEGAYKFVVLEITQGRKKKNVLVGNPNWEYPSEIVSVYKANLPRGIQIKSVLGCGWIRVTPNSLSAYGSSDDTCDTYGYGTAPQSIVEKLLDSYSRAHNKTFRVKMGPVYYGLY